MCPCYRYLNITIVRSLNQKLRCNHLYCNKLPRHCPTTEFETAAASVLADMDEIIKDFMRKSTMVETSHMTSLNV